MWVKIDDRFPDHPKIVAAGPAAAWLHVCGLAYCARYLTDGFIPAAQVPKLADVSDSAGLARQLVEVGLWDQADGGFEVHDFLDHNPSASQVKARREHDARRKRGVSPELDGDQEGVRPEDMGPVPVSVPVPESVPESVSEPVSRPSVADGAEVDRVANLLGATGTADRVLIGKMIEAYPERDPVDVAADYLRWQDGERRKREAGDEAAVVLRDPVSGWSRAMQSAHGRGLFGRRVERVEDPEPESDSSGIEAWDAARLQLRLGMGGDGYREWIEPLRASIGDGGELVLEAPDEYSREWLEQRMAPVLVRALTMVGHAGMELEFRSRDGDAA